MGSNTYDLLSIRLWKRNGSKSLFTCVSYLVGASAPVYRKLCAVTVVGHLRTFFQSYQMDSISYARLWCAASYCWPSIAVEFVIVCSITALKEFPSISGSELNPVLNSLFVNCPLTKPVTGQHLAQGSRVTPKYLLIADSFDQYQVCWIEHTYRTAHNHAWYA